MIVLRSPIQLNVQMTKDASIYTLRESRVYHKTKQNISFHISTYVRRTIRTEHCFFFRRNEPDLSCAWSGIKVVCTWRQTSLAAYRVEVIADTDWYLLRPNMCPASFSPASLSEPCDRVNSLLAFCDGSKAVRFWSFLWVPVVRTDRTYGAQILNLRHKCHETKKLYGEINHSH